ncbi:ejaculatory bulb-specific protein 3-like [Onthophagus taurus]|uniref:ejaculatory bulb-specific protein 3-like n=1 Tax=Onthophagus taurus TaxID=166361 RepID=UPI000C2027F4|nr:ejaculatory bulb-specific protein 3-like [Onthophagus taurus]
MARLVLLYFLIGYVFLLVNCADKYTTKYDGINVNDIINNRRLLLGYCRCLLGKSACSPDGAELKKNLRDAIETKCSRCSDKQKEGAKIILRHLIDHERDECWDPIEKEYDPTGKYAREYMEEISKEN